MKDTWRMSTCSRLNLQTLGFQMVMPKNLLGHYSGHCHGHSNIGHNLTLKLGSYPLLNKASYIKVACLWLSEVHVNLFLSLIHRLLHCVHCWSWSKLMKVEDMVQSLMSMCVYVVFYFYPRLTTHRSNMEIQSRKKLNNTHIPYQKCFIWQDRTIYFVISWGRRCYHFKCSLYLPSLGW